MIDRPHRYIETGTAGARGHREGEGNGKNERCLLYRSRPHCALHHDNCSFSCCRRDVVEPAAPFFAALTEISSRLGQCGVPLARGGSRSRGARHRRAARTWQSGGPDADAQASQEAGLHRLSSRRRSCDRIQRRSRSSVWRPSRTLRLFRADEAISSNLYEFYMQGRAVPSRFYTGRAPSRLSRFSVGKNSLVPARSRLLKRAGGA
jgi:hypothetical protein